MGHAPDITYGIIPLIITETFTRFKFFVIVLLKIPVDTSINSYFQIKTCLIKKQLYFLFRDLMYYLRDLWL